MRPAARPVSQMSLGAARVRERCSAQCWRHQPIRQELAPEVQGSTYNLTVGFDHLGLGKVNVQVEYCALPIDVVNNCNSTGPINIFSAFGGVPSGPACSPAGILPLWLGVSGERAC